MTPYARCSLRWQRSREAENTAWAARGDPRVAGEAARAWMQERLHEVVPVKTVAEILAALLAPLRKAVDKARYG